MAKKKIEIVETPPEQIIERPIERVLPDSMMPFSEYVLLQRAIPRIEDGLKPVQRRILYTMQMLGIKPDGDYKKSARIVGDCLGKYHPHGDTSVYDAMVRMAQDFSMRMTLVDGQGNFGSIGGDPAAAMRYTEVKLEPLALELLRDLDKDTVKFQKNFDDSLDEPVTLPGRFPNILVNGAMGIAIGLATNIPTHNLTEVIDGCIAMLDKPTIKLPELMETIKGPDFPSGAFMLRDGIESMYETGKGKVVLRAKADIENVEGDRQNIVITEIPYGVNPENLIKKMYDLRDQKKEVFGNVIEFTDESDRTGMRLVVKLKKGEDAVKILNELYRVTELQSNFNVNMVVIADGKPKQLGLIPILKYYLDYQKTVILRRSQYDLGVAQKRSHILDGLLLIMPAIDEVIAIIRSSATRAESKARLRERFSLSEAQAEAILCLQLGNINKLDVGKFERELAELRAKVEKLTKIIGSVKEQNKVIKEEMAEIRDKYKCKRLTTIVDNFEDIDVKPFDPTKRTAKRCFLAVDAEGAVKCVSTRNYISASREASESGLNGLTTALAKIETDTDALIIGSLGNCYKFDGELFAEKRWNEKGQTLASVYSGAPEDERAVAILSYNAENPAKDDVYIYTKRGMVKRSAFDTFIVNRPFYQVISLKDGDEVIGAEFRDENAGLLFVSSAGLCAHTSTEDYPQQGRIAGGVIGMAVDNGEDVVYAGQTSVEPEFRLDGESDEYVPLGEIVVVTGKGYAKRVVAREFPLLKRNRKGMKIAEVFTDKTTVVFAVKVLESFDVAIIDGDNEITVVNTEEIRLDSRTGRGKPVVFGKKIKKVIKHINEI